jgi:23S rRNA C2498 (ribose-2'-O)-methylase RlmM
LPDLIPEDIRQFILQNIDSIAQWEGLLLLRANADTEWTAETISARLYIDPVEAAALLSHLAAQGFLTKSSSKPPGFRFSPKNPELEAMISQMAALYRQYLIPITNLIHGKSKSRIQQFADAFRIRKD